MKIFRKVWPWLACVFVALNLAASSLKITTLNIRWYGLGGEISGQRGDEYRDPYLKEFLRTKYINTDIFIFQEIIDTPRLASLVDELGYHCVTYNHEQFNHQHLMICLRKTFDIIPEKGDNDFTYALIEDRPFLRPAIYGKVIDKFSKKPLVHLVGVHLKAGPNSIDQRHLQVQNLSKRISEYRDESLPVVVIGDFNTFRNTFDETKESDLLVLGRVFDKINMTRRTSDYDYTYRGRTSGRVFDHIYVTKESESRYVEVWGACGSPQRNSKRFDNLSWYKRFISDHCPVSFRLEL